MTVTREKIILVRDILVWGHGGALLCINLVGS